MKSLQQLKKQLLISHAWYEWFNELSLEDRDKQAVDENRELEIYIEGYIKRIPEEKIF